MYIIGVWLTSSPGRSPAAKNKECRALVPELCRRACQLGTPWNSLNSFSKIEKTPPFPYIERSSWSCAFTASSTSGVIFGHFVWRPNDLTSLTPCCVDNFEEVIADTGCSLPAKSYAASRNLVTIWSCCWNVAYCVDGVVDSISFRKAISIAWISESGPILASSTRVPDARRAWSLTCWPRTDKTPSFPVSTSSLDFSCPIRETLRWKEVLWGSPETSGVELNAIQALSSHS